MNDDWGSFEIEGLAELDAKLAEMDNATAGKALYGALNFASNPMFKAVKTRAPVANAPYRRYMSSGQGESTIRYSKNGKQMRGKALKAKRGTGNFTMQEPGTLKGSIKRRRLTKGVSRDANGASIAIYVSIPKGSKTVASAFYWHFLEYGTANMAAQPYLRNSFDENVTGAVTRFADKLGENIDKLTS